jgi:hypothetical protein
VRGSFRELLWGLRNRAGAGIDTRRVLLPDENGIKSWRLGWVSWYWQAMFYLCVAGGVG